MSSARTVCTFHGPSFELGHPNEITLTQSELGCPNAICLIASKPGDMECRATLGLRQARVSAPNLGQALCRKNAAGTPAATVWPLETITAVSATAAANARS